jgi:hypothetical protein
MGGMTTHWPAIELRRRWEETACGNAEPFDLERELRAIQAQAGLQSREISRLEAWARELESSIASRSAIRVSGSTTAAFIRPRL